MVNRSLGNYLFATPEPCYGRIGGSCKIKSVH